MQVAVIAGVLTVRGLRTKVVAGDQPTLVQSTTSAHAQGRALPVDQTTKTTVNDVAAYILQNRGPLTAMKLQKLVYYCQAWSLVWDERPLFDEEIRAWANGPVVRELYNVHRGCFMVERDNHDSLRKARPESLDSDARETIDQVLNFYGNKDAQWLSELTHKERPWREARGRYDAGEASGDLISLASMEEYYSSLLDHAEATAQ